MSDLVLGDDGGLVRSVGPWAEEKLFYIQRYIDIFTRGMKNLWPQRVYIDLFAGPGICKIEGSGTEVLGTPLLALGARESFTHAFLNDADPMAIEGLRARTRDVDLHLEVTTLDCNDAALSIARDARLNWPRCIGLAVIDPTAFQIRLDALEQMTRDRRIDLIITLMTGHLRRFIGEPSFERNLDPFFGSAEWRKLVDLRAGGGRITFRRLLDFYAARLRSIGYPIVDDDIRILNSNEQTIYHLVCATKDDRGLDFFKKISQRRFTGQRRLI